MSHSEYFSKQQKLPTSSSFLVVVVIFAICVVAWNGISLTSLREELHNRLLSKVSNGYVKEVRLIYRPFSGCHFPFVLKIAWVS